MRGMELLRVLKRITRICPHDLAAEPCGVREDMCYAGASNTVVMQRNIS